MNVTGFVLVNTENYLIWLGPGNFYLIGDEPHVYPTLQEAAEARQMYVEDSGNEDIHIFEIKAVEPTALKLAYKVAQEASEQEVA